MKDGLERVVAAKTVISHADGESGKIWVRGRPIEELVARHGFEGSVALVWEGFVGEGFARADVVRRLGEGRRLAFAQLAHWLPAAKNRSLAEALRLALAVLPDDSEPPDIAATLPVAIAALLRIEQDQEPIAPDPALGKAEDFLRMLNGCAPAPRYVTALDHYLTTVIDNGLGSSAFAARVIISTKASLVSAILGAYLAFTGPLHGGAPSLALDMLDAIAASGDVDAWLDRRLSAGERWSASAIASFAGAIRAPTSCARRSRSSHHQARALHSPAKSSAAPSPRSGGTSPIAPSKLMSKWMRRCCSRQSVCRGTRSRRSSPWRARRPGSHMRWSRSAAGA